MEIDYASIGAVLSDLGKHGEAFVAIRGNEDVGYIANLYFFRELICASEKRLKMEDALITLGEDCKKWMEDNFPKNVDPRISN